MNPPHPKKTDQLSPHAAVAKAKAELLQQSSQAKPHPVAELIRDHPGPSVGLAAVAGFLIVALKPGRLLMRQVFMAGFAVMLRKALLKYLSR